MGILFGQVSFEQKQMQRKQCTRYANFTNVHHVASARIIQASKQHKDPSKAYELRGVERASIWVHLPAA